VLAAGMRARHPALKLPDALVIATAASLEADRLVTTDRGWPTRAKLRVQATIIEI
jgi:predicted nucleic acid-binding protein